MSAYPGAAIDLQVQPDGSVKDLVSGSYATIVRNSNKYGIDPTTGLMTSVGPNLLFPEPYKSGWSGQIEEARTNYIFYSSFETDSNADGLADQWALVGSATSKVASLANPLHGTNGQRVLVTGGAGDVNTTCGLMSNRPAYGTFAQNDILTASIYVTKFLSNMSAGSIQFVLTIRDSGGAILSSNAVNITGTGRMVIQATCPANTSTADIYAVLVTSINNGSTADVSVDCAQLEKGAGATSFIPTTNAFLARPRDDVNFPTTQLGTRQALGGETFACVGATRWASEASVTRTLFSVDSTSGNKNKLSMYKNNVQQMQLEFFSDATPATTYLAKTMNTQIDNQICVGVFTRNGLNLKLFANGLSGSNGNSTEAPASWGPTIAIGRYSTTGQMNGPFHRLVAFSSGMSDNQCLKLSQILGGELDSTVYPGAVADFQLQKDGTFMEMVGGLTAVNTRLGSKYGFDPSTGLFRSYEGYATNYLLTSGFHYDANSDGLCDNWVDQGWVAAGGTFSKVTGGQRMVISNPGSLNYIGIRQMSKAGTFAAGENATASFKVSGSLVGATAQVRVWAYAADGTTSLGYVDTTVTINPVSGRVSGTYSNLPASTSRVDAYLRIYVGPGNSVDITIENAQLEKGLSPSSFIETGNSTASRSAAIVPEGYPTGYGYWGAVEEARTNYLLHSGFEVDSNSDGLADGWVSTPSYTTLTLSLNSSNVLYGMAQRVRHARIDNSGSNGYPALMQTSLVGTFVAGDVASGSLWYRNFSYQGSNPVNLRLVCFDVNGASLGETIGTLLTSTVGSTWTRAVVQVTCPANTSKVGLKIQQTQNANGDFYDVEVCCAQLEKGTTNSSFIPTTATTVTRAADVITYPSANFSTAQGAVTFVAEDGSTPAASGNSGLDWSSADLNNKILVWRTSPGGYDAAITQKTSGTALTATKSKGAIAGAQSIGGTWLTGGNLKAYTNGAVGASTAAQASSPISMNSYVSLFCPTQPNKRCHRMIIHNYQMNDTEMSTLSTTILAGPKTKDKAFPNAAIDLQVQPDGSVKDLVSGNLATITRIGAKFGINAQNTALNQFDGVASNLLLQSGFEGAPTAGLSAGWSPSNSGLAGGSVVRQQDTSTFMFGSKSQRMTVTGGVGDVASKVAIYQDVFTLGGITTGDAIIGSVWLKGSLTGAGAWELRIEQYDSGSVGIGTVSISPTLTNGWTRYNFAVTAAAGLYKMRFMVRVNYGDPTTVADVWMDGAQMERGPAGSFLPSSYIETTTVAVARPAALLAAERYLGTSYAGGYWAAIEEARTNYLLNTYMTSDVSGMPTSFVLAGGIAGTKTYSRIAGGLMGDSCARLQATGSSGDANASGGWYQRISGFVSGDVVTVSCWIKGSIPAGSTVTLEATARTSGAVLVNTGITTIANTNLNYNWQRVQATVTCGANTAMVDWRLLATGIDNGDVIDLLFCSAQMEKCGTSNYSASSYIPTKAIVSTRLADDVEFPSSILPWQQGAMFAVLGGALATGSAPRRIVSWRPPTGAVNALDLSQASTGLVQAAYYGADGTGVFPGGFNPGSSPYSAAMTWSGVNVSAGGNGGLWSTQTSDLATGIPVTPCPLYIGSIQATSGFFGGYVHRVILFNYYLGVNEGSVLSAVLTPGVKEPFQGTVIEYRNDSIRMM